MRSRFYNPTDIRWSCWSDVGELLGSPRLGVLIVAARSSQTWAAQLSQRYLSAHDVQIVPDVQPDPTAESVQSVVQSIRDSAPDWVIALGGGSVLDTAKAAALLAKAEGDVLDYLRGLRHVQTPGIPLVAIPTTAGSGSEVTPYASLTDVEWKKKTSLTSDYLYPRYAILDEALTVTMPPLITAISGMDALCHAIEAYWSNHSNPVTDAYALSAAKIALDMLPEAFLHGDDLLVRRQMLEGSMLAGLAISNARTTAAHAISYPMTVFYRVPHGIACGMVLPQLIRYNSGAMNPDKEKVLLDNLGFRTMNELADAVECLKEKLQLPVRLRDLGIRQGDLSTIVANGFRPDRINNNPRAITSLDFKRMLKEIL